MTREQRMKKLNLAIAIIVVMIVSGCGSDNKYSGNYGGVSGANAAGTTTGKSVYTNGEESQELTDTLLVDLLGEPAPKSKETDTTEEAPTTITTEIDTFTTRPVGYLADSNVLPVCFNTEETILEYSGTPKFTCEWYCGIYEGDGPIHVRLSFLKEDAIWTLDKEDLSTASSNCHD